MKKRWLVLSTIVFVFLFMGYNTTESMKVDSNDIDLDITTINNYTGSELNTIEITVSWDWNEQPFWTLKDAIVVTWENELFYLEDDSYQVQSYYYKGDEKLLCDEHNVLSSLSGVGLATHFDVCSGKQIIGNISFTLKAKDINEVNSTDIYVSYIHNYLGNMNAHPIEHKKVETTGKYFGEYNLTKKIGW